MATKQKKQGSGMRGLALALAATFVGLGMIVGGGLGLWNDIKGDDSSSKSSVSIPRVEASPFAISDDEISTDDAFTQCNKRDGRLQDGESADFKRVRGTGTATLKVSCLGDSYLLGVTLDGVKQAKVAGTMEIWIYNSKHDAEQVGTIFVPSGGGIGTGNVDESIDTRDYDEIVLVPRDFTSTKHSPSPVAFRLALSG